MPRTIVPEEQQRASDLSDLRDNFRPTKNRTVHVDSDADGAGNIFRWDPNGEATNYDGVTKIKSNISEYNDGGASEGLWRRMQLPFAGASTEDLPEAGSKSDAPDAADRLYFRDSRAINAIENNPATLQINKSDSLTNGIDMNDSVLTGLAAPSGASDATTKEYVDGIAQGLEIKDSSDVATPQGRSIDLSSSADPNPIDGYTLQDGDRILLKEQSDATENGIYVANTATDPSTWTRSEDLNEDNDVISGSFTFIENGTENGEISYIIVSENQITLGSDPIDWSQFAAAGEIIANDGLTRTGNTLDIDVSDFAGTYLSDDSNENLQVNIASGLTGDGSDNIEVDLTIDEAGETFNPSNSVNKFEFGDNLDLVDNTSSGNGIRIDVNATDATSVDVQEGGGTVNADTNTMNFTDNVKVTGSGNLATISVPDEEIQDATFASGSFSSGVLNSSKNTRITVEYDKSDNNDLTFTVDDNLDNYDNGTTDFISGVILQDSTTEKATNIETINFGSNLNVSDSDGTDKLAKIDAVDTLISTKDAGTEVTAVTEALNFTTGLSVVDDGSNQVSISNDARFGQQTFSGDDVQTEFQIAHGLTDDAGNPIAPSSWVIEATTDDGSGHSHSTADSTNITVFYDTPPPNGSNNIKLNYSLSV